MNFKFIIIYLTCFISTFNLNGQGFVQSDSYEVSVQKPLTHIGVNYFGLVIHHERKIFMNNITVQFGGGIHRSFYSTSSPLIGTRFINVVDNIFGREYKTSTLTPYLCVEFRKYVNIIQRHLNHKRTENFASDYVSIYGEFPFSGAFLNDAAENLELAKPLGFKYGIRRNIINGLLIDGGLGIVGKFGKRIIGVRPRIDFSLTFVL